MPKRPGQVSPTNMSAFRAVNPDLALTGLAKTKTTTCIVPVTPNKRVFPRAFRHCLWRNLADRLIWVQADEEKERVIIGSHLSRFSVTSSRERTFHRTLPSPTNQPSVIQPLSFHLIGHGSKHVFLSHRSAFDRGGALSTTYSLRHQPVSGCQDVLSSSQRQSLWWTCPGSVHFARPNPLLPIQFVRSSKPRCVQGDRSVAEKTDRHAHVLAD